MPTTDTPRGIRIRHSDDVEVTLYPEMVPASGGVRAIASDALPEARDMITALGDADLALAEEFRLSSPGDARSFRATPDDALAVEVPLENTEGALLLIESGGVYFWRAPDPPVGPSGTRLAPGERLALFTLAGPDLAADTRSATRNAVVDWALGKVRERLHAYVFKFIVREGVKAFVTAYEYATLQPGAIVIKGFDPKTWTVARSPANFAFAKPAKILILIHGTFSSTQGSFGALTAHPVGRAFLAAAYDAYDAVIGFDHSTLAEDPSSNANHVFEKLKELPAETVVDFVTFSRGALVTRTLVEDLLPKSNLKVKVRKVVFVGCTNAGTHLAEPKNIEDTVDLYTNIVMAAGRVLSLIPGAAAPAGYVMTAIKVLGTFVRYLAETALEERQVPGLAAMQPAGAVVGELNGAKSTAGAAADYYAVTADFKPDDRTPGFTRALALYVADRVVDRIFEQAQNDLVVDTASMANLGEHKGLLRKHDDYGTTAEVYHTIYFAQERVARDLSEWLELPRAPKNFKLPAVELEAELELDNALGKLSDLDLRFDAPVLVCRREPVGVFYYTYRVKDFADKAANRALFKMSLTQVFDLHETTSALMRTLRGTRDTDVGAVAASAEVVDWVAPNVSGNPEEVLLGPGGVVGVLLPELRSIQVSRNTPVFKFDVPTTVRALPVNASIDVDGGVAVSSAVIAKNLPGTDSDGDETERTGEVATAPAKPIGKDTVTCNFAAEMPRYPKAQEEVDLVVTISREAMKTTETNTAKLAAAQVTPEQKIDLLVVPRKNCALVPPSVGKRQVDVPAPGKPLAERFRLKLPEPGPASVVVEVQQGARSLVTFQLEPVVEDPEKKLTVAAVANVLHSARDDDRLIVRIYEITEGAQTKLRFIVDSQALHLNIDADSEALGGDRKKFIEQQYQELEKAMPTSKSGVDYAKIETRLKRRGNALWNDFVPRNVREELWKHRHKIAAIQVISGEPFVPWELVVMSDPTRAMTEEDEMKATFWAELGLVRWVQGAPWPGPDLKIGDGKILYVAPDYPAKDYRLSGSGDEIKALQSIFPTMKAVEPHTDDVLTVLRASEPPEILHFICHGETNSDATWNASLLLQGENDKLGIYTPEPLNADDVKAAANLHKDDQPGSIVFLNACRVGRRGRGLSGCGGFAEVFVSPNKRLGASLFIGPLWNVRDKTAVIFARTFYDNLVKPDTTLVVAVKAARAEARKQQDPSWLAYSVYGDPFARRIVAGKPD